jgi:hypothetical protein
VHPLILDDTEGNLIEMIEEPAGLSRPLTESIRPHETDGSAAVNEDEAFYYHGEKRTGKIKCEIMEEDHPRFHDVGVWLTINLVHNIDVSQQFFSCDFEVWLSWRDDPGYLRQPQFQEEDEKGDGKRVVLLSYTQLDELRGLHSFPTIKYSNQCGEQRTISQPTGRLYLSSQIVMLRYALVSFKKEVFGTFAIDIRAQKVSGQAQE